MSKFTEGKWVLEENTALDEVELNGAGGDYICAFSLGYDKDETTKANMRLIAQSPDMYAELKKVLTGLIDYPAIQKILDRVEGEA